VHPCSSELVFSLLIQDTDILESAGVRPDLPEYHSGRLATWQILEPPNPTREDLEWVELASRPIKYHDISNLIYVSQQLTPPCTIHQLAVRKDVFRAGKRNWLIFKEIQTQARHWMLCLMLRIYEPDVAAAFAAHSTNDCLMFGCAYYYAATMTELQQEFDDY